MKSLNENAILNAEELQRELLKVAIVGHVDHGKSTFVGRLFYDTDSLPEGKYENIVALCKKRGVPFEYAFLMDSFQAERDQGITIDTSQIWFKTQKRDYTIIDAPGHKEFLKNMVTGAAQSDAALLMIDAKEGVREQSKRHGYLLNLLGVKQIAVVVNKMDLVDYSQERFDEVEKEYREYLATIGVEPTMFIPISAREGDHIIGASDKMPWYQGLSVVECLDHFKLSVQGEELPLRVPVQDIYKFDERRIIAGTISSGSISVGDEVVFSPSGKRAKIETIEAWPKLENHQPPQSATTGDAVGVTLDEQIFIERGEVMSHISHQKLHNDDQILIAPHIGKQFKAKLFWLAHNPLKLDQDYQMKLGSLEVKVKIVKILNQLDAESLAKTDSDQIERNQLGEVIIQTKSDLAIDDYLHFGKAGRFVLIDQYHISGGGIISTEGFENKRVLTDAGSNITRVDHQVAPFERVQNNGHKGGVIWMTGLSGAGKSTLAFGLERQLFNKGYQTYVLDGDNLRFGLNKNLGFSDEDRKENIRRASEVASLMARAGFVVIVSLISPFKEDREAARLVQGSDFYEVFVSADLATCESRDPKGLYQKARAGEIQSFTGISSDYEAPEAADLIIDTEKLSKENAVDALYQYVAEQFKVDSVEDYSI